MFLKIRKQLSTWVLVTQRLLLLLWESNRNPEKEKIQCFDWRVNRHQECENALWCCSFFLWGHKQDSDPFLETATDLFRPTETVFHWRGLYSEMMKSFTDADVPVENIVGFGSDGCNTMMRKNNSVSSRLRNDLPVPGITVQRCVSLCAIYRP